MKPNKIRHNTRPRVNPASREKWNGNYDMAAVHDFVRDLQEKIACAVRNNDMGQAEVFGSQLINSLEGRIAAVQRVATNRGKVSAGLSEDGFYTNEHYENMLGTLEEITNKPREYKANPLDRLYILKADGVSKRPLSIPSYRDRCLQALYKLALEPVSEEFADASSYGFRPIRSTIWAVAKVMTALNSYNKPTKAHNFRYVLELDIKGCYDNIDHKFLRSFIPIIHPHVLKEWLTCGYLERENKEYEILSIDRGVPQGGIISPTLANMTLNGIEVLLKRTVKVGSFCRYADDMVAFYKTKDQAEWALREISGFLASRGLEVKEAKTRILDLEDNSFKFVGFEFSRRFRRNKKRKSSFIGTPLEAKRKFQDKIRKLSIEINSMAHFIEKANQVMAGTSQYYRFAHDSPYVLKSLDFWTRRQYYKKGYNKMKSKFDKAPHDFLNKETRARFFGRHETIAEWPQYPDSNGMPFIMYNMPKQAPFIAPRFTNKVKNAFIYDDRIILDKVATSMKDNLKAKVLAKWNNCCGMCLQITDLNNIPVELHHIIPKRFGGRDSVANLIPLCKEPCHQYVSSAMARKDVDKLNELRARGLVDIPLDTIEDWQQLADQRRRESVVFASLGK